MKYEQLWKDIETLCALRGPSGREAAIREYLIEQIKGHAEYEAVSYTHLDVYKRQALGCHHHSQGRQHHRR